MTSERRAAAVIICIESVSPHNIVFVERGAHLRNHAGQIGLPGGSAEPEDAGDLAVTALRELHEEVGIAPQRVTIVGHLPQMQPRVSPYDVMPFVAVVEPGPLTIDTRELDGAFVVPLTTVLEELYEGHYDVGAFRVKTPLLDVGERRIWGLTGHILREFAAAWNDPANPLRRAVEAKLHGT
jgi:8-oxo-dGTP pyrophosphatase MutT (NUDIX family)